MAGNREPVAGNPAGVAGNPAGVEENAAGVEGCRPKGWNPRVREGCREFESR